MAAAIQEPLLKNPQNELQIIANTFMRGTRSSDLLPLFCSFSSVAPSSLHMFPRNLVARAFSGYFPVTDMICYQIHSSECQTVNILSYHSPAETRTQRLQWGMHSSVFLTRTDATQQNIFSAMKLSFSVMRNFKRRLCGRKNRMI